MKSMQTVDYMQKIICIMLTGVLLLALTGCASFGTHVEASPVFSSPGDIPGITDEEINAIETLRSSREVFIYGGEETTECFVREDGSFGGFATLFTGWLTELFGIPFQPAVYTWDELIGGLESHEIDFTGDLTPTQERRLVYYMTSPIVARPVVEMRIAGNPASSEIAARRAVRYIFIEGAITHGLVHSFLKEPNEVIFVKNDQEAYKLLENGDADIFVEEAPYEATFDKLGNVEIEEFFPLINSTVSLTTQNPQLEVIISVVQKALDNGMRRYLTELYNIGHKDYLREKLRMHLTESEKEYIRSYIESGEYIPVGLEFDNYPTSFYNTREQAWQGIAFDVLEEIEELTGLTFIINHHGATNFTDLIDMLESGEVALVSEVIPTAERAGKFLFTDPYASDYYALISLMELADAELNDVYYLRIGLQNDVAYTEVFRQWFPNHPNTVPLVDALEALDAMERGEIDMYMGTRKLLLQATNYLEKPGYKTNIVFNYKYDSAYGVNLNEPELHSIINKAMLLINTDRINEQWTTRIFNYQGAVSRARTPYLIGSSVMMLGIIALLVVMFYKGKKQNVLLSAAVSERTHELEEQMQLAVAASESKSRFLATMSHEIRTPMNAIIGITQIELQNKDNPNAGSFEKIYKSGTSLLGIINDILDMSKIETGKLELYPAQYDVPNMIYDSIQMNIIRIESKPIEFILDIDGNLPSLLFGDELRLKQILNNLLSNAIKYTEKGHVKLTVKSQSSEDEVFLIFSVEDTGHGMKPEDRDKLFSEYLRFYNDANRTTEGTGLGLNITKKLVEMMDGTIGVESDFGKGSTFTAKVKQKAVPCDPIGAEVAEAMRTFSYSSGRENAAQITARCPMPYGKVLVVDDVESNLYVASGLLAPYRLNIETATSGFIAIDKVNEGNAYDIIFMDHMMPHMDGIETTKKLRESGYGGTIIALTANALVGNDTMFTESGFDGFISKPVDISKLDKILNTFVRDKHPEEASKYEPQAVTVEQTRSPKIDKKLMKIFTEEARRAAVTLKEKAEKGDIKAFTTTVHAMKSALANIGEAELSANAAELEKAGRSGDEAFIAENASGFIGSLEKLVSRLESENGKPEDDTVAAGEEAFLREQLDIIIKACEDYDDTAAFTALDALEEKHWNGKTADKLEKIRNALFLDSDFEKALETAQSL